VKLKSYNIVMRMVPFGLVVDSVGPLFIVFHEI
jgi:hypothetical protein